MIKFSSRAKRFKTGCFYSSSSMQLFCTSSNDNNPSPPLQPTLLTGLQPTGSLHLGNYFGSITNIIKYQNDPHYKKRFLFIADLHSLTTAFASENASIIQQNQQIGVETFQMVKMLLACGVDPQKTNIFIQSHVPQHAQLTWIFSCLANKHALDFMVQFKEKSKKLKEQQQKRKKSGNADQLKGESVSVGLYTYPLLMASDILLYRATHVPVGKDQVQHLELANKLGDRFNQAVGVKYFPHVEYVEAPVPKIMSLTNPEKKMSKSDTTLRSRILLTDGLEEISEKIRRAVTDSQGNRVSYDVENRKGLSNLIELYSIVKEETIEQIVERAQKEQMSIAAFKKHLIDNIWKVLQRIQNNMSKIDDKQVQNVIAIGLNSSRQVAESNMKEIKNLLKLYKI